MDQQTYLHHELDRLIRARTPNDLLAGAEVIAGKVRQIRSREQRRLEAIENALGRGGLFSKGLLKRIDEGRGLAGILHAETKLVFAHPTREAVDRLHGLIQKLDTLTHHILLNVETEQKVAEEFIEVIHGDMQSDATVRNVIKRSFHNQKIPTEVVHEIDEALTIDMGAQNGFMHVINDLLRQKLTKVYAKWQEIAKRLPDFENLLREDPPKRAEVYQKVAYDLNDFLTSVYEADMQSRADLRSALENLRDVHKLFDRSEAAFIAVMEYIERTGKLLEQPLYRGK